MTTTQPADERNLDRYDAPLIEWDRVRQALAEGLGHQAPETGGPDRHTLWLATANPDGTPHVMPLGVMLVDGSLYFTSGAGTRKAKNLARNPRCAITAATHAFDVVMEGEAVKVTDDAKLQRLADVFSSQGWEPEVRDGAFYAEFSAPSAGPPPWELYEMTPTTVFALGTAEPYGATRFRF
jgi:nitroimidazol reductase NimA-like FMN-containing flavoprotein (pyridoxamine 5'-phosphate oxidase superfamily)